MPLVLRHPNQHSGLGPMYQNRVAEEGTIPRAQDLKKGLFHVRRIFSIPSAMDAHTAGVHSFAEAVMMNSTPEPR